MMAHNGLAKLIEECGEVIQVAGKLLAYPAGPHPDGQGDLSQRLEDEIADVMAAARFVAQTHGLSRDRIAARVFSKLALYDSWHSDPSN